MEHRSLTASRSGIRHEPGSAIMRRGVESMRRVLRVLVVGPLLWPLWTLPAAGGEDVARRERDRDPAQDLLQDEFAFLEEDAMVESAARHKQRIGMSPSAITVITREDIVTSGARTVPDLLRLVPGMNIIVASPLFTAATTRMDWDNENNTMLVLIDGRPTNLELLGQPPFELQPIVLEDIERIEVIQGPGSSLYGANALAGVINITTREIPDGTTGWARVDGGEAGGLAAAVRASWRQGRWALSLGGGADVMGTWVDPRRKGKRVGKLRLVGAWRPTDSSRLVAETSLVSGTGIMASTVGMFDVSAQIRTLRLAWRSDALRAQLYWLQAPMTIDLDADVVINDIRLATIQPYQVDAHTLDTQAHWTIPRLWEPLLLIAGCVGRVSWLGSDQLLDAESFADPTSPDYHRQGISHWEGRAGGYLHAELEAARWATVTGGLRFDYNTVTGPFISPRLAAVFMPVDGQFFRLGAARSFRKPAFIETHAHLAVDFPEESPITGPARQEFQEFMTRVIGNPDLVNEELWSFEAGYLGEFLDDRLRVNLDLYFSIYSRVNHVEDAIVLDEQGLPDLQQSSAMFQNRDPGHGRYFIGAELMVRYSPTDRLSFMAYWAHRKEFYQHDFGLSEGNPKNMLGLGGRFRTGHGLLGSLYLFTRSEFTAGGITSPEGLLGRTRERHMDNVALVIGRFGWEIPAGGLEAEAGLKLFLPVSPFSAPHFNYREEGGFTDPYGRVYGGELLGRQLTAYLQGSF